MSSDFPSTLREPTTPRLVSLSAELTFMPVAAKRRGDAKDQPGEAGDRQDEQEDAPIERRELPGSARQQLFAPVADEYSKRATHRRQEQALGHQLSD